MLHFFLTDYFLREKSYSRYEFFNFEVAKWAEYYLGQKTSFHQSNWCAGRVTENPQDILLGHPTYAALDRELGKLQRNWVQDNALHPGDSCHPNTYILMPWVPEFPQEWAPNLVHVESQLLAAQKIFAFCGQIWIDRTLAKMDESIQAQVKHKLIRCNIGVATQNLPYIKQKFNPIGNRQLLHISTLGSYKGFDITCESIQGLNTTLNVGSKSLQAPLGPIYATINGKKYGFNFLGEVNNADPNFNQWVVDTCDFYIHTGTMDAQATVILENCTRGLIPLVTPESGYASPHAIYLTHDPEENRQIIDWALNQSEEELLNRSSLIRQHIQEEHSWEIIFNQIWEEIVDDMNNRKQTSIMPTSKMHKLPALIETLNHLGLREINRIIFPNWSEAEAFAEELRQIVRAILASPDCERITLLVDTSGINPEAADGLVAEVVMDLLMQEDIEINNEPQISLIAELNDRQWQTLLQNIQARIPLVHENKIAIAKYQAEYLPIAGDNYA